MNNPQNYSILHYLISAFFFLVSAVLFLVPDPGKVYVELFGLTLLPILLCSLMCGPSFAFLAGLLAPLLSFVLWRNEAFIPTVFLQMLTLAISGLLTGIVYKQIHYPLIGVLVGIITGRVAYGIAMVIYYFRNGATYTLERFVADAVEPSWPGFIICAALAPVIVQLLNIAGVMTKLGNEPAGKAKEIVHRPK